ncbi:MAG: hypothetical protein J3K34DRAFT_466106 [Monoraphidium minutum]|nr:MAG: hypothetical protein J3K34DRAFT_466106 [Monoraphidium minutum]
MHRAAAGSSAEGVVRGAGPKVPARVAAVWDETPSVKGLRIEVDPAQFTFQAGQWVDFWVPGIKQVGGFSIVTTPAELAATGTFELGVKATQHPVARWAAAAAAPGAPVAVRPGGSFSLSPASLAPGAPALFVAGGIGVTPLASMIAELVQAWAAAAGRDGPQQQHGGGARLTVGEAAAGPQAVLLYSARAPQEFALLPRLLELQRASRGALQLRLHCSEFAAPAAAAAAGGGKNGDLWDQAAAAAEAAGADAPAQILLRDGVRSLLRRRLLPQDLAVAVADLRGGAAGGGGGGGCGGAPQVVAYVCGPPALSDQVVAELEGGGVAGVGEVVMERWW